ncbi:MULTISPECIES: hypothetical protein [Bacteria]|uniref:hypothetical protein n=1 Tax=Bacteria TaxID=2 RepID=UPI0010209040|nr:hypothetical protein [Enterococcus durans]MCD5011851.1 hypothetical protein [Enterococcus durans]MDU1850560.1 hypothetical protein [Enterococcus durans]MZG90867.1 hypothetical protein [Enterococcus durans]MZG93627.1 hypothetical protein [Enterococcus durans]MZH20554.1 hypothetical protein [Enterococcus durans]
MPEFYIKEIIITGLGKRDSSVSFTEGLNIVSGPSNTGKTSIVQAIDFMYGDDTPPFSKQTGYDTVLLRVASNRGEFLLSRGFDDKEIIVSEINSEGTTIGSKSLKAKPGKKPNESISKFWLELIGIDEEHQIIKNSNYKAQTLTWRTFSHSLLISERLIGTTNPILIPEYNTLKTAYLSALIFLISGNDSTNYEEIESADHRKVRKASISRYINDNLMTIYQEYDLAKKRLDELGVADIEVEVDKLVNDLTHVESRIVKAANENRKITQQIGQYQEKLDEDYLLVNRYSKLRSQYKSDLERLTLIVDGERLIDEHLEHLTNSTCPFCNGELPETERESYIEAARADFNTIMSQLDDLSEASQESKEDIDTLVSKINSLSSQKQNLDSLLDTELQPRAAELEKTIDDYHRYSNLKHELAAMESMQQKFSLDLKDLEEESPPASNPYKPLEHFDAIFWREMSEILKGLLERCNYRPLHDAYFSKKTFDLNINGDPKQVNHGKGYRSFLNTLVVLAYRKVLADYAKFNPGVFVIDTPLLGLDEGENARNFDSMQQSLFQYFIEHQSEGQLIIVENTNELPKLNYAEHGVHEIVFTHDENKGRYGFLLDIESR